MKKISLLALFFAILLFSCENNMQTAENQKVEKKERPAYVLVIHGGAGAIRREDMTPEKEAAYKTALDSALTIGETVLKNGGTALDAVEQTIIWLEDCPFFNAGRGAVFTHEGKNELDASIMDGATQHAGAVGGVTTVKNPIRLARTVMEKSPHVFLAGRGAEQFAAENGLDPVEPKWFFTQERWDALQQVLKEEKEKPGKQGSLKSPEKGYMRHNPEGKFGTVGCVALDKNGNLAAGTSTGGMTNKRWNRIGDSPVIGAGTYASNDACAVSCTGHGEYFIRYAVAHDVWALMAYKELSLDGAADLVVNKKLVEKGGEGGLIAVDKDGNIALPFNSAGMYRGYAKPGERKVMIYKE
ncbi:MAG: isoaspartyl peptidase/L-asparaginase [Haliscomenobacteraceae bacterium CHB4]|nr:Isoaspartyl peptidase [Saprospiraceae bacterium]MCE7922103.1 isoaspartyl peptidase/L-asparaginase [Haliscomenobacteraceae bacterium CHB4]